jgi:hypothetical protein
VSFTNSNNGNASKNVGTIQLIDGYFHNYDTTQVTHTPFTVTDVSGEGFDTVTNFANPALTVTNGGGGNDVLQFNGLSNDATAANYWANVLSSTTANGDTTIHVHDVANNGPDVSAVKLVGVTADVATLVHDGAIQFNGDLHLV